MNAQETCQVQREPGVVPGQCRAPAAQGHAGRHRGGCRAARRLAADHGLRVGRIAGAPSCWSTPWKRNGVKVSGEVDADITQQCVVTLEPIEVTISEAVSACYFSRGFQARPLGFHAAGEVHARRGGPRQPRDLLRRDDRRRRAGRGVLRPCHRPLSAQARALRSAASRRARRRRNPWPLYEKLHALRRKL